MFIGRSGDGTDFLGYEVDEFRVGFDAGSSDHELFGSDVVELELLKGVGVEVVNVLGESSKRHAESSEAECGFENFI